MWALRLGLLGTYTAPVSTLAIIRYNSVNGAWLGGVDCELDRGAATESPLSPQRTPGALSETQSGL